jgi:hypothetical protein
MFRLITPSSGTSLSSPQGLSKKKKGVNTSIGRRAAEEEYTLLTILINLIKFN